MDRACLRIGADGPLDNISDEAAGIDGPRNHEVLRQGLTGHGFIASLACAGLAAMLVLGQGSDGFVAHDRAASIAVLTLVVVCGVHVRWGTLVPLRAVPTLDRVLWCHRVLLLTLGTCCAVAIPIWGQPDAAASTACAGLLMLIGGLGVSSAAADRISLLVWLSAVLALPAVLALASSSKHGRDAGWMLFISLGVLLWLAGHVHLLLLRAGRVRRENDRLVAQLRHHVLLVETANKEKTRFLGAASHDLRQPMHALGLFTAALEKALRGDVHHAKVIHMTRAVDALEDSFSAMLDVFKLDAGVVCPSMQTFPIRDVFYRLHLHCAGAAEEKGLSLRFKPGGKLVTSDPLQLERILSNLIHNAIRYTSRGGVLVVARTRDNRTSLEVWDTGIGIHGDQLPHIFNEFFQIDNAGRDRDKGLGMGLSIVKRLVLLLGHELEVASVPGRGTVFRVLLPPTQFEEMSSMILGADTLPPPLEDDGTVLVIDDEAAVRAGMNEMLQCWGFTVLLAGTIDQARAAVLRHHGPIDIVVSDLRLAHGESGLNAIDEVRRTYGAPMPAVLVTGDTSPEEVQRARASGHSVLFKPVHAHDLFAALRAASRE
jgi:signal transduction histidine kinase/CheY-like chemotaxis protein